MAKGGPQFARLFIIAALFGTAADPNLCRNTAGRFEADVAFAVLRGDGQRVFAIFQTGREQ